MRTSPSSRLDILARVRTRLGARPTTISRWYGDRSGAFSVHFALAMIPLAVISGGAIDFNYVSAAKVKLDAAADSAVLAAVGQSTLSLDATAAQKSGLNTFNGIASTVERATVRQTNLDVTDSGLSRSASVSYTADVPTTFLQLMGMKSLTVSGSSSATFSRAPYLDFYLLLDNTPSMGVGATTADINKMVANTSDQCAFACHDLSNSKSYYNTAKKLGVTMRIDVLRTATQKLMDTATATATVSNQFRMAVYTFGSEAEAMGFTNVVPLSYDLASAKTQAGVIDLMTVPNSSYNNDQDTPFDAVLAAANAAIPNGGGGTAQSTPQKVLFFVSDGVADQNLPTGCTRPTTGGRCQEPLTVSLCSTIKARGVKIAVLYTTYLPLPTNSWYNSWIKPFSSSIATNMQACASPGLYFEVSPSGGISEAMTALFKQAILSARLTQ